MGLFKPSIVAPEDGEAHSTEEKRGLSGWIRRNPVAASVLITFLILGLIAAIVVPVTCSVHGCPPKKQEPYRDPLYDGAPTRLVVSFLSDIDVADLVPPLLKQYTGRIQSAFSNLQVIEAIDESILDLVEAEIQKRTGIDLEFMVRDFVLRSPPDIVLEGSTRRRAQAMALNDPGLGQAYWFNKINVTGAWSLLSLSAANINARTSDVVIAVTDSGAQVDHPDLIGSWWVNPGETEDGRDNDNNTFIDDVHGACFSTKQCSPFYATSYNYSLCGIGPNTRSLNNITDRTTHGTKIAGVIGATANNSQGIAGVAPNLRQMILKVTDETFSQFSPPYAYSDVVRAVDYGYGKGARIFSMSFGNDARNGMTPGNKPSLDAAARAYTTLFNKYKDALFVAAAGNEWTNLDDWRRNGYTYSPCMVGTSNVLCVGATDSQDRIFYVYAGNRDQGTNWGPAVVDVGAPGADIYTTTTNGGYESVSGTSFATPMTAAVAGLVLAALGGQGRATSDTPTQIKNILTSSGDPYVGNNGASFISMRRLNAARAVEAALVLARTNRTVLKPLYALDAVSPTWLSQSFEHSVWTDNRNDGQFETINMTLLDYYVRMPASATAQTTFNSWRYVTPQTLQQIACWLRIDVPGQYSVMASTRGVTADKWQLVIGENTIVWRTSNSTNFASTNNVNLTSDLRFPEPGWYSLTLWVYPTATTDIRLLWTTPSSPVWGYPPNLFWTVNDQQPDTRNYDPNVQPKPALWHMVWNETNNWGQFDKAFFLRNGDPRTYRDMQATVADLSFASTVDMKNALYGSGNNFPSIVYGYARANLRPAAYSSAVAFRLQGPHTRLVINGHHVFDFQSDSQLMVVTPCLQLQNNTAHEIYFYFATRLNGTNPIGIQWTPCTNPAVTPGGLVGGYSTMTPSLATNFWWQPASVAGLPRGMRCDAWAAPQSVITNAPAPAFNTTPPTLSWMYPRDCHPDWRTGNGECRVATRLAELYPQLTWNMWTARCWTYWSSSFADGQTRAANLGGAAYQHLAGRQVYTQPGDGVTYMLQAPKRTNFSVATPLHRTPGVYQLYSVEWIALGSFWNLVSRLQVMDGTVLTNVTAMTLTTNNATMVLPPTAVVPLTFNQPTKEAYSIP